MGPYDFFESIQKKNLNKSLYESGDTGYANDLISTSFQLPKTRAQKVDGQQHAQQSQPNTAAPDMEIPGIENIFSKKKDGQAADQAQQPAADVDGGEGSGKGLGSAVSILSAIAPAIPNAKQPEGQTQGQTNAANAMNSVKDAVGQAIPIAGAFRAVEKLGVNAGQMIGGDHGQAIAQAYFSPSDTMMKILSDPDMSGKDKTKAALSNLIPVIGPALAGNMIHKANRERIRREEEKNEFWKKTQRERDYVDSENRKSLERLMALKKSQMNYISDVNF